MVGLLLVQALFYYSRFPLSLGPHVILQPWLLQNGFLMYENIADQHSPLMPLLLSVPLPIFANGLEWAKIVLVGLVSLTTMLTFWAGRRSSGWLGGLAAAMFFVIWSPAFDYGKLWHESFLAPFYLLFLLPNDDPACHRSMKSLVWLGLVGGIAVLIKQQAALVLAAFILWRACLDGSARRSFSAIARDASLTGLAAVLPIGLFAVYHYAQVGSLTNFWYWTIGFNLQSGYASLAALSPDPGQFATVASAAMLLPLALFRLFEMRRKGDPAWLNLGWGFVLMAVSSLTAYPRFDMFHLQPVLPILGWLSATALVEMLRTKNSHGESFSDRAFIVGTTLATALFLVISTVVGSWVYLLGSKPQVVSEYSNLQPLAGEIRQLIAPADRIYIFPDDEATANLYYILGRMPPRFWVLSYPWYLHGSTEQRMLQAVQEHPPEWIVYFPGRWDAEQHAFELFGYIESNYPLRTQLHWDRGQVWLLGRPDTWLLGRAIIPPRLSAVSVRWSGAALLQTSSSP